MFYHQSAQTFAKTQFSLRAMPNKQYWNTSPRYYHHHPTPGLGSQFTNTSTELLGIYVKFYMLDAWQTFMLNDHVLHHKFFQAKTTKDYILLMAEILHQLRLVVYPNIYRVSAPSQVVIAGFQPSTVTQGLCCEALPSLFFHEGNGQVHSQLLTSVTDSWWANPRETHHHLLSIEPPKISRINFQPQLVHDSSHKLFFFANLEEWKELFLIKHALLFLVGASNSLRRMSILIGYWQ